MAETFVDTSGWAAWIDRGEQFHPQAREIVDRAWDDGQSLITTNWVLAELTGLLTRFRMPKPQQIKTLACLRTDPSILVISIERTIEASAWKLWEARPDKDWSLVDCASFVVMEFRKITDALTSDHHFEQAGFVRLLKNEAL